MAPPSRSRLTLGAGAWILNAVVLVLVVAVMMLSLR
jgi:hypothetical protein